MRTTATMMLALFILAVLILVNSLIAAMTKMFDEVWRRSTSSYAAHE